MIYNLYGVHLKNCQRYIIQENYVHISLMFIEWKILLTMSSNHECCWIDLMYLQFRKFSNYEFLIYFLTFEIMGTEYSSCLSLFDTLLKSSSIYLMGKLRHAGQLSPWKVQSGPFSMPFNVDYEVVKSDMQLELIELPSDNYF